MPFGFYHPAVRSLLRGQAGLVLVAACGLAAVTPNATGGQSSSPAQACSATMGPPLTADIPQSPVAQLGGKRITEAELIARDPAAFAALDDEYERKLRQLEVRREQDRYALIKEQTEKLLDATAVEMEAKSRGTSTESVLADIKVRAVTDAEEKAFYEANRAQTSKSFDEVKPEITQLLASKHDTEAVRSFHDELRARYHLVSLLEPYRLEVPGTAVGPARGSDKAPVTIVEFGDFQCPYCRQAEDTLKVVMGMHPDDVRLVFRELPLAKIHPHALEAARAAVCADRQGQFWSMHDAMYQDQTALDEAALKQTAKRIGLDGEKFAACLRDDATAQQILGDVRTADELAITGTPFFLINGRPINGNVPVDQFEAVLLEELKRAGAKRG